MIIFEERKRKFKTVQLTVQLLGSCTSFLLILFLLNACVLTEQPKVSKAFTGESDNSVTETPTPAPTAEVSSISYLQNGAVQTSSILSLEQDFSDIFYLRGQKINNFTESIKDQEKSIKRGVQILKGKDPKASAQQKQKKMLEATIDVTKFMVEKTLKYGKK